MTFQSNQTIYVNYYVAGSQILRHVHRIHKGADNFHALNLNCIFLYSNEVGVSSAAIF